MVIGAVYVVVWVCVVLVIGVIGVYARTVVGLVACPAEVGVNPFEFCETKVVRVFTCTAGLTRRLVFSSSTLLSYSD